MGDTKSNTGDYEKLLFQYQSQVAKLERNIERLELEVEELKRENKRLKGRIVDKGKKAKTDKSGLGQFGASFQ